MNRLYSAAEQLVFKLNVRAAALDHQIHDLEMCMKDYRMANCAEDKEAALNDLHNAVLIHLPHFGKPKRR